VTEERRIYGLNRVELQALRKKCDRLMEERLSAGEVNEKVARYLQRKTRATARQISIAISVRLPDIRQSLARLIDLGVVERDGDLWEDSVVSGQREAAAYKWIGEQ